MDLVEENRNQDDAYNYPALLGFLWALSAGSAGSDGLVATALTLPLVGAGCREPGVPRSSPKPAGARRAA